MARIYASILGFLAFLLALARGGLHGQTAESAVWAAWLALVVFAVLGSVAGGLAERIVGQEVRWRLLQAADRDAPRPGQPSAP